jgi:Tfp pilus assembly protein FimT
VVVRRAMTLLEVLLVLCLLVILASLAWPVLERPLANQRLRQAADVVRTEWTRARVEAMSSGRTMAFTHRLASDAYRVEDLQGAEYVAETVDEGSGETCRSTSYALPEGCQFVAGESRQDDRAAMAFGEDAPVARATAKADADTGADGGAGATAWSDPILFYPDGTTSDATVVLGNEYGRRIELSLRGLTGVAAVGELYDSNEGPR